ncbi:hypothetical protein FQR65_LT15434 [Abscondita terminalis]|nr:hypothetical protein FQR65_LT15434 [Abscondita terminalis]
MQKAFRAEITIGGCEVVDEIETIAIDRAKQCCVPEWVNVLSLYSTVVEKETGLIDYKQLEDTDVVKKPKSNFVMRSESMVVADISHPAGLIARRLVKYPLPHCHIVTTTTHKTLRGPRGGMIMVGKDFENPWGIKTPKGEIRTITQLLDLAVFPGTQGGPLEHTIAAKAIAYGEALSDDYMNYIVQVKDEHLAEDIFQETFIKVINTLKAGRYNDEGKFLPWVMRIAHNMVIDHFRREKRAPSVVNADGFDIFEVLQFADDNAESRMVKNQRDIDLRKIIQLLPDDKKENKFKQYSETPLSSGLSGKEIAQKMLNDNGIYDVQVISVDGQLTDHYNPQNKTVNLSPEVYEGRSVAAAAVAAHECGHAVQHATAYSWLQFRSAMVPVVGFASKLTSWILMAGVIMFGHSKGGNYWLLAIGVGALAITSSI